MARKGMSYARASFFAVLVLVSLGGLSGCDVPSPRRACLAQYQATYIAYANHQPLADDLPCPPIPPSDSHHEWSVATGTHPDEQHLGERSEPEPKE